MNRENIQKVRDAIAASSPSKFGMATWLQRSGENIPAADFWAVRSGNKDHTDPECGTAACISGWAIALGLQEIASGKQTDYELDYENGMRSGRAYLELTKAEADSLFVGRGSGKSLSSITKDEAVAALDILLETGQVDWAAAIVVAAEREKEQEALMKRSVVALDILSSITLIAPAADAASTVSHERQRL